jgi:hypothetical protein
LVDVPAIEGLKWIARETRFFYGQHGHAIKNFSRDKRIRHKTSLRRMMCTKFEFPKTAVGRGPATHAFKRERDDIVPGEVTRAKDKDQRTATRGEDEMKTVKPRIPERRTSGAEVG